MCLHHEAGMRGIPYEANREMVAFGRNGSISVSPFWMRLHEICPTRAIRKAAPRNPAAKMSH
jgi:hypothetical protein